MITNPTTPLAEVNATLALSDLNRRERLLKIIQGKPAWLYHVLGVLWAIFIIYLLHTEKGDNNIALLLLMPLGFLIFGVSLNSSRRMNALIELIGEETLKNRKVSDNLLSH